MFQRRLRIVDKGKIALHLCQQRAHFLYVIALGLSIIAAVISQLLELRIFSSAGRGGL